MIRLKTGHSIMPHLTTANTISIPLVKITKGKKRGSGGNVRVMTLPGF